MSDRLTLAQAIADAGIPREKAENIAAAVIRLAQGGVTTKADLQAQGAELKTEVAAFRGDLKTDIAAVKADVSTVRAELQTLKTDLQADITGVRTELRNLEIRLDAEIGRITGRTLIRVSGVLVVLLGLLFAALHACPPH